MKTSDQATVQALSRVCHSHCRRGDSERVACQAASPQRAGRVPRGQQHSPPVAGTEKSAGASVALHPSPREADTDADPSTRISSHWVVLCVEPKTLRTREIAENQTEWTTGPGMRRLCKSIEEKRGHVEVDVSERNPLRTVLTYRRRQPFLFSSY